MCWSIGYDPDWKRDIGYGVPAFCDHPECGAEIDRGLAYVCGAEPYGGERGCGLFFCPKHQMGTAQFCPMCRVHADPYPPKPDHPEWVAWKLSAPSWARWREENPAELAALKAVSTTTDPEG